MTETTTTERAAGFLDVWDHYLGDVPDRDGQIEQFKKDVRTVLEETARRPKPNLRLTDASRKVLKALLNHDGEDPCGFQICKATGMQSGIVYPILRRMEAAGWVASHWQDAETWESGPRRRFCRFTDEGRARAREVGEVRNSA